jgi:5-methylcytosine-specific restriction endonuclease McrA
MTRTCKQCGEDKPLEDFRRNRPNTEARRLTCIPCEGLRARKINKARHSKGDSTTRRRLKVGKRAARIIAFREHLRRVDRALREPTPEVHPLRTLYLRLNALLKERCKKEGVNYDALTYRVRYRSDAAFRDKEIARRWAKKAKERTYYDDGTLTSSVLRMLFGATSHCTYCMEEMGSRDKTLDHMIPLSRGGAHSLLNVTVCCRSCNLAKRAKTPDEWKPESFYVTGAGLELSCYAA